MQKFLLLGWTLLVPTMSVFATDHLDSPRSTLDPSADVADLFIFVPEQNKLVIAMDLFTGAGLNTRFSDAVKYQFRIHPFASEKEILSASPDKDTFVLVECTFSLPNEKNQQSGSCGQTLVTNGNKQELTKKATFQVGDFSPKGQFSTAAGLREDPFVLNGGCAFGFDPRCKREPNKDDSFEGLGIKNALNKINTLSIVVELNRDQITNKLGSNLLAFFGEIRTNNVAEKIIDRMGRPEVTNFLMRDDSTKYPYNQESTLAIKQSPFVTNYLQKITKGIFILDTRDQADPRDKTQFDWQGEDLTKLQTLLLADYLVIDASQMSEFSKRPKAGYFSIELELINQGASAGTKKIVAAGGRSTQEDEIDSHITFLINGPKKQVARQDGVPKADIAKSFPYTNAAKKDSFLGAKQ